MFEPKQIINDYADCFEHYLAEDFQLCVVILDEHLRVVQCNACFRKLLGTMEDLSGQDFQSLLLPESRSLLPFNEGLSDLEVPLNLITRNAGPICLASHIYKKGLRYLVLGGNTLITNHDILEKMSLLTNEMANLMRELSRRNKELEEARSNIKVLGGIIPICMHCKQIRDDKGYWNLLEKFITENSEAHFSHSICDACMNELYPDDDL